MHPRPSGSVGALAAVGGFEIAVLAGAILGACARSIPIVLDGLIVGLAGLVTLIVGVHARSRLGGVTGDTLGATSELSETTGLVLTLGARMSIVCARPGGASRLAVGTLPFDTTTAVVTHGGVVRALLADALGLPDSHIFRLGVDYASVSIVDRLEATAIVRCVSVVPLASESVQRSRA